MLIGMATFEHLPIRVGGLAEAVTSLAEALSKEDDVDVFMPSHGLTKGNRSDEGLDLQKYADFSITVGDQLHPVSIYHARRRGVRLFLLSSAALDTPSVYYPRAEFIQKMVHFSKALPGLINLMIKREGRKPEVIHINDWHCVFAGALVKKYFQIPFVYTIHRLCRERISARGLSEVNLGELVDHRYLEGEMFNIEVFGGHQCDYLTTVSYTYLDEEWSSFFSSFQGKVTYVWNGADASFWDPAKLADSDLPREKRRRRLLEEHGLKDGTFFFNVGRLDTGQKGIDTLLQAFELLCKNDAAAGQIRLILIGTGDPFLESEAERLASSYPHRMRAVLRYLNREATREFYGAADFCLIPSNFEPFGLVQLEAMCMGCIPIGSRVGGINDTVIDLGEKPAKEATGLLVQKRDPEALAGAMLKMAELLQNEPAQIEKMRRNGREHVIGNFSWESAARRYRLLYRGTAAMKLPFVSYAEPY